MSVAVPHICLFCHAHQVLAKSDVGVWNSSIGPPSARCSLVGLKASLSSFFSFTLLSLLIFRGCTREDDSHHDAHNGWYKGSARYRVQPVYAAELFYVAWPMQRVEYSEPAPEEVQRDPEAYAARWHGSGLYMPMH